jgi:hypothetical protein
VLYRLWKGPERSQEPLAVARQPAAHVKKNGAEPWKEAVKLDPEIAVGPRGSGRLASA